VHEPEWPPQRDLPVRQALQVAAEVGLAQGGLGLELGGRLEVLVDDPRGLDRARERAVNDAVDALAAQRLPDRGCLRATQGAELKARQVAVRRRRGFSTSAWRMTWMRVRKSRRSYATGPVGTF